MDIMAQFFACLAGSDAPPETQTRDATPEEAPAVYYISPTPFNPHLHSGQDRRTSGAVHIELTFISFIVAMLGLMACLLTVACMANRLSTVKRV